MLTDLEFKGAPKSAAQYFENPEDSRVIKQEAQMGMNSTRKGMSECTLLNLMNHRFGTTINWRTPFISCEPISMIDGIEDQTDCEALAWK